MIIFGIFAFAPLYFYLAFINKIGVFSPVSLKGFGMFIAVCLLLQGALNYFEAYLHERNKIKPTNTNKVLYILMIGFTLLSMHLATLSWNYFS